MSTKTGRDREQGLQLAGRTIRIRPSAQDVDDLNPGLRLDRPQLQPCCTSTFVPTILALPEMHIVYCGRRKLALGARARSGRWQSIGN